MSKNLYELMSMQQIAESYPTKKQVQANAIEFANRLINNGEHEKLEMFSQAVRIKETINTIYDAIKDSIPAEKQIAYGVEISPTNGRIMIQFAEDEIYADLQKQLKDREELLKVALKSDKTIYDDEGVNVPKVSVKYAADSLTIKY
jgi:predicted DNA-binding protein YlxM (UPF0122 family)